MLLVPPFIYITTLPTILLIPIHIIFGINKTDSQTYFRISMHLPHYITTHTHIVFSIFGKTRRKQINKSLTFHISSYFSPQASKVDLIGIQTK